MREIKQFELSDMDNFVNILVNAYPGFGISEDSKKGLRKWLSNNHESKEKGKFWGLKEDSNLLGTMRFIDYTLNYKDIKIPVVGLGGVAVDLLHKKEQIAKEMLSFFIKHHYDKNVSMLLLYPFNAGFYKKMGWGLGVSQKMYSLEPQKIPNYNRKSNLQYLNINDSEAIISCYNEYAKARIGLLDRDLYEIKYLFENPFSSDLPKVIGYKKNGNIEGYLVFSFKPCSGKPFINDIVVKELVYNKPEVLNEFCTFLHSQKDQISKIKISSQDEDLIHLFTDPSSDNYDTFKSNILESSVSGIGVMYRVINVNKLFKELKNHNFNKVSAKIKIIMIDDFLAENNKDYYIDFNDGYSKVSDSFDYDAELEISVKDFSSLIMGAINFKSLYNYGLVKTKNPDLINKIFFNDFKPECNTYF